LLFDAWSKGAASAVECMGRWLAEIVVQTGVGV
jgi:hypothetical protein